MEQAETKNLKNSYEKVGPTAWGIAYRRAACDIPFAREIFDELAKTMTSEDHSKVEALTSEKDQALTPQFEARYKLLNRLLRETDVKQVLELAAGIAPRGIEMAQDSAITYVELDLPGIIMQKKTVIDALVERSVVSRPDNLYLESGSATGDLSAATSHFDVYQPVAVIHEGLMRYLNFEEKTRVARNAKEILERFGGVYITPDITLKVFMDERVKTVVSNMVGMDINANAFESVEAAEKFFGDIGFAIEKHSFAEARDELISPARLGLSDEQVASTISTPVFFVMHLK